MPLSPPTQRPPQTRVLDAVAWNLGQISQSVDRGDGQSYYTKQILIERKRDPRNARVDRKVEYGDNPCLVTLRLGDERLVSEFGSRKRYERTIELLTLQSLRRDEDQQGVTLDMLPARLREDIVWRLDYDSDLNHATAALNGADAGQIGPGYTAGMFGATSPCCIGLHIENVIADKVNRFPDVHSVLVIKYLQDEWRPGVTVGDIPPPLP